MTNTNLVGGTWATNGAPLIPGGGGDNLPLANNYVFVNSVSGYNGYPGTADQPVGTLTFALTLCNADAGDCIVLQAGHAETISGAAGIAVNVAGVYIVGLGAGSDRPTFTFSTSTAATMTITAANITIQNIIGICNIDQLVTGLSISGAGCTLGTPMGAFEWQDSATNKEALAAVTTTAAASNFTANLIYRGQTGGSHNRGAFQLVGANKAMIYLDAYGKVASGHAWVEMVTTASVDVEVYGYMYCSGVTNYTRDVVDTVTGSTWFASFNDGSAGFAISGGSGNALGPAQAATVIADLAVPSTDSTANLLERDVVGSKADTAVTISSSTGSLAAYAKGIVNDIGTITNSGGTASLGAIVGDFANTTLISKFATAENAVTGSTAVMVDANTLFTIAGGPIKVESLMSICIASNGTTASTLAYYSAPTVGTSLALTTASASLASFAAGASVAIIGTSAGTTGVTAVLALASSLGPVTSGNPMPSVFVPAGTIKITVGTGSTTGTWKHYLRYRPLVSGVTVTGT